MNEFLAGVMGAILALLPGGAAEPPGYAGYLEADYVHVAASGSGRIASLGVAEGEAVTPGQALFLLEDGQQQALLRAAEARVEAARATLENLETGSRSEEIEVIEASLSKARADLALAEANLGRSQRLFELGTGTAARVDQDRAALAAAQAQVNQLTAQVSVAELPARSAQQLTAEANLAAAEADASRAALELEDRRAVAPVAGSVERLYFSAGETVAAGAPVLSILPEGALKARFFVPETARAGLAVGAAVTVACDGCEPMAATVTHLASTPQTTPPVIYSREERERLVYLVEARLEGAGTLQPGQPVTVTP